MPFEARDVQKHQDPNQLTNNRPAQEWRVDADILQQRLGWSKDLVRRVMSGAIGQNRTTHDADILNDDLPPPVDPLGDWCDGPDLSCVVVQMPDGNLKLDVKGGSTDVGEDTVVVGTLNENVFCENVVAAQGNLASAEAVKTACVDELTVGTSITVDEKGQLTSTEKMVSVLADGEIVTNFADAFTVTSCPVDLLQPGESVAPCVEVGRNERFYVRLEKFIEALKSSTKTRTTHPGAEREMRDTFFLNLAFGVAGLASIKLTIDAIVGLTKAAVRKVVGMPAAAAEKITEQSKSIGKRISERFSKTNTISYGRENPPG